MTDSTLHALTQRVDHLEKESCRWKAMVAFLSVLVVAIASLGAAAPNHRIGHAA
jgi:hypothetical protein